MNRVLVLAATLACMASFGVSAKAGKPEMEAAALLAFNAAEMCHNQYGLYLSAAEAHRNGHSDQKIKAVSDASPGSYAEAAIDKAIADAKSGINTSDDMYGKCMKKVREDVYKQIESGKTS
ncbi:hypothetical protein GIV19_17015 [Pseudomonas syringae]|uniref:hypothetical protein n=1 Tax=Pseudomonas syringae TaxID=317 RepID=UPI001F2D3715|nr:hypothetical protein [Pseudomonas syringae]MCF5708985.1 hypothetical protein [Pseudomonas syringae]